MLYSKLAAFVRRPLGCGVIDHKTGIFRIVNALQRIVIEAKLSGASRLSVGVNQIEQRRDETLKGSIRVDCPKPIKFRLHYSSR